MRPRYWIAIFALMYSALAFAQARSSAPDTVAGIPVNYDESKVGNYVLPDAAPFDANMLIALIAPRPLLLQTGSTDNWSDPKGEFLAEIAAGPVYRLLGKKDLGTDVLPAAKQPIMHDLSYYMHDGGHGMAPSDWDIYLHFLKEHLHPEQ